MYNNLCECVMLFKIIGMICLVMIVYISFLTVKHSQIDKFGGDSTFPPDLIKEINELKRKTIFKLITNFFILTVIAVALIGNILNPEALSNQITLVIFIAGVTSLGIKLGFDLSK